MRRTTRPPPRPGEISLAYAGALLLDEIPELPVADLAASERIRSIHLAEAIQWRRALPASA